MCQHVLKVLIYSGTIILTMSILPVTAFSVDEEHISVAQSWLVLYCPKLICHLLPQSKFHSTFEDFFKLDLATCIKKSGLNL